MDRPPDLERRAWLQAASTAALGAGLPEVAQAQMRMQAPEAQAAAAGPVVELQARILDTTLAGRRVRLRSYNGSVPGPLLTTRPGQTLRVRLHNDLPRYDSSGWDGNHNVPHGLDITNLHVHGLDVAPHLFEPLGTTNPLAAMIHLRRGQSMDYAFALPADHPPGLYWYHPHHHGSTAVQAVSGMAGGIIVRGDIDEVPAIKAAREVPLIIQDIGLFPSDSEAGLWEYNPRQNAIWNSNSGKVTMLGQPTTLKGGFTTGDYAWRLYLVNGEPFFEEAHVTPPAGQPVVPQGRQLPVTRIRMAQGEVVRFRLLNACSDNLMPIVVEGHDMHLLALDGVNFPAVRVIPAAAADATAGQVLLAPSNRAEFLIRAVAQAGVYRIVQLAQSQQFLPSPPKVIAEIEVTYDSRPMALPTALPVARRYDPPIRADEVTTRRTVVFGGVFPGVANPVVGIDFLLNNMQYQEQAVPMVTQVGAVEEWTLQVLGQHHGGTEGHPFHIHVNHFEVVSIDGKAVAPGTVQDTVWVPMHSSVVVRMRFKQFAGKTVFHCHILPHEDTGMMQNILILPA